MPLSTIESSAHQCLDAIHELVPDSEVGDEDLLRLVSIAGRRELTVGPLTLRFTGKFPKYGAFATYETEDNGLKTSITSQVEFSIAEDDSAPSSAREGREASGIAVADAIDLVRMVVNKLLSARQNCEVTDMGSLSLVEAHALPPRAQHGGRRGRSGQLPLFVR